MLVLNDQFTTVDNVKDFILHMINYFLGVLLYCLSIYDSFYTIPDFFESFVSN